MKRLRILSAPHHGVRSLPASCPKLRCCSAGRLGRARQREGVTAASSTASASQGDGNPSPSSAQQRWDELTDKMVVSSSIPFSILVLPQVVQNIVNMSGGNTASLSIISWEGYLSGLLGNLLMCTHFAGRGERSAVNVQLIGIMNSMMVLCQVALAAFMPLPVFIATLALTTIAVGINVGQLKKGIAVTSLDSFWGKWQLVAGVIGMAVIPQVMSNLLLPGKLGLLPGLATLLLLTAYFGCQVTDAAKRTALGPTVAQLPGWAATLFFALSPLPQLVRNFLEPQCLEGLSVGTMVLALMGNALMMPRALYTRDTAWIAGSSWGTTAGWGQLLSMFLGSSALTGQSYLSAGPFAAITLALLAFVAFTLTMNGRVQAQKHTH